MQQSRQKRRMRAWPQGLRQNVRQLFSRRNKERHKNRAGNAVTQLPSMPQDVLGELERDRITGKIDGRSTIKT